VGAEEWQVADGAWEPGWVTVGLQAPGPAEWLQGCGTMVLGAATKAEDEWKEFEHKHVD
jgi:hypothetical protein